jgi:hypothetical protein
VFEKLQDITHKPNSLKSDEAPHDDEPSLSSFCLALVLTERRCGSDISFQQKRGTGSNFTAGGASPENGRCSFTLSPRTTYGVVSCHVSESMVGFCGLRPRFAAYRLQNKDRDVSFFEPLSLSASAAATGIVVPGGQHRKARAPPQ